MNEEVNHCRVLISQMKSDNAHIIEDCDIKTKEMQTKLKDSLDEHNKDRIINTNSENKLHERSLTISSLNNKIQLLNSELIDQKSLIDKLNGDIKFKDGENSNCKNIIMDLEYKLDN
jgi:hypothetical protein